MLYYKFAMLELHKYHQLTASLQVNEFLDPRDHLGYSLDLKSQKFCQQVRMCQGCKYRLVIGNC